MHADWSVRIALDRLEKATARAAFVAWAEMTTALRADGTELRLRESAGGGACGVWVDREGRQVIEVTGTERAAIPSHE